MDLFCVSFDRMLDALTVNEFRVFVTPVSLHLTNHELPTKAKVPKTFKQFFLLTRNKNPTNYDAYVIYVRHMNDYKNDNLT